MKKVIHTLARYISMVVKMNLGVDVHETEKEYPNYYIILSFNNGTEHAIMVDNTLVKIIKNIIGGVFTHIPTVMTFNTNMAFKMPLIIPETDPREIFHLFLIERRILREYKIATLGYYIESMCYDSEGYECLSWKGLKKNLKNGILASKLLVEEFSWDKYNYLLSDKKEFDHWWSVYSDWTNYYAEHVIEHNIENLLNK